MTSYCTADKKMIVFFVTTTAMAIFFSGNAFHGVALVIATYASVTSALPACVCTREMKPVCGTDGETYNNMCLLRCQQESHPGLQLQSHGPCRSAREAGDEAPCTCIFEYDPVCGSDGRTYVNRCAMDCGENRGNVELLHEGECSIFSDCPLNYLAVCGTDGDTYANECFLKRAEGVEVAHTGACKDKREVAAEGICMCPAIYAPVCGTDGKTYSNECILKCAKGVEVAHTGACKAKRDTCLCPLNHLPVCGTDGKTYDNECILKCAEGVEVAHTGACKDKREVAAEGICICPAIYAPVCGTDGKTYDNRCSLKCKDGVEVAHAGACKDKRDVVEPPACFCTYENDPVCGTNGRTYDNMCALECEGDKVQLAYKGDCRAKRETVQIADLPPCICTLQAQPVCGTDGKTYSNPCMLNCVREQNEDLNIDYPGPCRNHVKVRDVNPRPPCACTRNLQPVCASNGRTYNNECLMRCAGADLTVESNGPCTGQE